MSFLLTCPNCGVREVTDFGFGGESALAPEERRRASASSARTTTSAATSPACQREWWLHRSGCGEWFIAERDTRTNEVHWTRAAGRGARGRRAAARRRRHGRRRRGERHRVSRLPEQPGERIDRDTDGQFTFDGKPVDGVTRATRSGRRCTPAASGPSRARSSTTAAAALMCCAGQCPNCLVSVDGAPGVRALHRAGARGHARRAHERGAVARLRRRCAPPTCSAARSPRPASTTRPSSGRVGCGRCTRRCCATRPGSGKLPKRRPSASGAPSTAAATPTCS